MAKLRNAAKSITDGTAETPEWSDAVDDLRQRSDSTMLCLQEIRAELREARRHREALEASRVVAEAYHAALKAAVFDLQRQLTPFSPMLHGSVILPNPNMLGCDVELAGGNSCGSLEVQDGSSVVGGGDRSRLKDWLNCGGDTSDLADFNMSQIHAHKVFVEMSDSNTCSTPSLNCMPKQAIVTTSATSVASSPLDARLHVAAAPRDVFKQDINICGGVEVECKGIEEKDATSSELKVNKVVEVSGGNGGRFERVGIGVVVCDADRLSGDMLRRTRIGVDRNMKPSRRPGFLDESRKNEWCDVFHGSWVWDESYPLYHSKNCSFLDGGFRCNENGRPDSFYTKWRWQLKDCNLPRFDARIMLERLRNRRLVFAGDSIGRNQWESLLCMLSSVVTNKTSIYEVNGTPITKHSGFLVFKFEEFNCTVEYYRSPFLVLQGHPPAGAVEQVKMTLKVTWATLRLSDDKVKQCVDAKLKGEYPPKGVAKLAAVAALCVQCEAEFRPNMSIVVKDLQPLLKPPAAAPPLEL